MSWSPAQRALLEAMGYTPFGRAGAAAPVTAASAASADAAPADGEPSPRLREALRRAARGRDLDGLLPGDLSGLRADPAAKRALWSRLRALRRH